MMKKEVNIRRHLRRTKKGYVPVKSHTRRIEFSDDKKRSVPIFKPMRPKDLGDNIPVKNWIAEEKKDGSLTLQYIDDGAVAYLNRRGTNKTDVYPELTDDEIEKIKTKGLSIIQGETYALKGGKDDFETFLKRDLLQDPEKAKKRMKKYPLRFEAFDIVMKDGKWVNNKPLSERKKLLKQIVNPTKEFKLTKVFKNTKRATKRLKKDSTVEGVIYKKEDSKYKPGKQKDWLKNKFRKEADVIITGYKKGKGKRKEIGTLTAKVWDPKKKKLKEVASVGTGFTDKELKRLKRKLDQGKRVFGKVEYLSVGSRGRLREPSWKGERLDLENIKETHF